MPLNNGQATSKGTLLNAFKALEDCINYNMNCVKIATVVSFDKDKMTACCKVNNKRLYQLKQDGNQILKDYPLIYAKVHFFGWSDIGACYPIKPGMEGMLLFNDRELETWFLTSDGGNLAYDRCHDLSDAIFICGLHSQPKIPLLPFIEACLHIYYQGSDIQIKDESITTNTKENTLNAETSDTINTKDYTNNCTNFTVKSTTNTIQSTNTNITSLVNITGNTSITGTTQSTTLQDLTAATNTFTTADGKLVTVVNGIVRTIVG